ncbi:hypothetical protein D3C78_1467020 [compost metagenome]
MNTASGLLTTLHPHDGQVDLASHYLMLQLILRQAAEIVLANLVERDDGLGVVLGDQNQGGAHEWLGLQLY